jgi:protein-tyrosine phosphatase
VSESKIKKILFVCLGNICRSPMGEGMMKHLLEQKGESKDFFIDSAGTSACHIGNLPDARMRATALKHGVQLESRARQFRVEDFTDFDLIVAMDSSNYQNIVSLAKTKEDKEKVVLMRAYDESTFENEDVPDPYYGGDAGFENVYQIINRCCSNLLKEIENEKE